jgi:hypothetical protein
MAHPRRSNRTSPTNAGLYNAASILIMTCSVLTSSGYIGSRRGLLLPNIHEPRPEGLAFLGALEAAAREKSALLKRDCKSNGRAYLTFGLNLLFRAKEVVKVQYDIFFKRRRRRWW